MKLEYLLEKRNATQLSFEKEIVGISLKQKNDCNYASECWNCNCDCKCTESVCACVCACTRD